MFRNGCQRLFCDSAGSAVDVGWRKIEYDRMRRYVTGQPGAAERKAWQVLDRRYLLHLCSRRAQCAMRRPAHR
jgi:hypothetical protein